MMTPFSPVARWSGWDLAPRHGSVADRGGIIEAARSRDNAGGFASGEGLPRNMYQSATPGLGTMSDWAAGGPQWGDSMFGRGIASLRGGDFPGVTQYRGNFYGMRPWELAGRLGINNRREPSGYEGIMRLMAGNPPAQSNLGQAAFERLQSVAPPPAPTLPVSRPVVDLMAGRNPGVGSEA